ncbi:hypothetical protein [Actinomyces sp.]|uniref:hypothetical protein n=1 Tax=Actinomyces sp. TaxID=29317 RepID=UPI00263550A5|nr:hypothetical protein [Actinomyces sp.]MDK8534459.1 hypothetical protein [Gleimia europaea]MDU7239818.1 hypothetical protein [Actinomyces sp.]
MTRESDVIGGALVLAERATNNATSLVSAMAKINELDSLLIDDGAHLQIEEDIENTMTILNELGRIARNLGDLYEWITDGEEERENQ